MSPFIAFDRATGRLRAVAGASGGPLIVSATLQALARLLLEGADAGEAVWGPRVHDQLLPLPTAAAYENGTWAPVRPLPGGVVGDVERRGQAMRAQHFGIGVAQAISVEYDDDEDHSGGVGGGNGEESAGAGAGKRGGLGVLVAVSDLRKDGAPFASTKS